MNKPHSFPRIMWERVLGLFVVCNASGVIYASIYQNQQNFHLPSILPQIFINVVLPYWLFHNFPLVNLSSSKVYILLFQVLRLYDSWTYIFYV